MPQIGQAVVATNLLADTASGGEERNAITYTAAFRACKKGGTAFLSG